VTDDRDVLTDAVFENPEVAGAQLDGRPRRIPRDDSYRNGHEVDA
jgi:hypothetical protein